MQEGNKKVMAIAYKCLWDYFLDNLYTLRVFHIIRTSIGVTATGGNGGGNEDGHFAK